MLDIDDTAQLILHYYAVVKSLEPNTKPPKVVDDINRIVKEYCNKFEKLHIKEMSQKDFDSMERLLRTMIRFKKVMDNSVSLNFFQYVYNKMAHRFQITSDEDKSRMYRYKDVLTKLFQIIGK